MARPIRETRLANLERRYRELILSSLLLAYTQEGKQKIDCIEIRSNGDAKRITFRNRKHLEQFKTENDADILLDGKIYHLSETTQKRVISQLSTDQLKALVYETEEFNDAFSDMEELIYTEINSLMQKAGLLQAGISGS